MAGIRRKQPTAAPVGRMGERPQLARKPVSNGCFPILSSRGVALRSCRTAVERVEIEVDPRGGRSRHKRVLVHTHTRLMETARREKRFNLI